MKHIVFTLLLASASISGMAQNTKTIQGTITDGNGEPVIGATIKVGKLGTITDINGNYTLSVPNSTHQVEVSYIGMKTQKVSIKGNKASTTLQEDSK